jgi:hypothetical protein
MTIATDEKIDEKTLFYERIIANWDENINSGKGLFEVRETKGSIGPGVGDDGKITGAALTMESTLFGIYATEAQNEFDSYLHEKDKNKQLEYMLTIIGAIPIWKEDIDKIRQIIQILTEDDDELTEEETHLQKKLELLAKKKELLETKKFKLKLNILTNINENFISEIDSIEKIKKQIEDEIEYLKDFLKELEQRLPFLFK